MIRDTWRAILALVVGVLLLTCHKALSEPVEPTVIYRDTPSVETVTPTVVTPQPAYQPTYVPMYTQPQPDRPLRRVASSLMELGDSVIGVVR